MSYYNNGIIHLPASTDSSGHLQRDTERERYNQTQNHRTPSLAFYASPGGLHLHNMCHGGIETNSVTNAPNNVSTEIHDQSTRTMTNSVSGANGYRTNYGATDTAGYQNTSGQSSAPPRSSINGNHHYPQTFVFGPPNASTHTYPAPRSGNNPSHQFQNPSNQAPSSSNTSSILPSTTTDIVESSLEPGGVFVSSPARRAAARRAILKPDIGIILSIIAFIVWIRLFQAMFYNSVLGHLEGFIRDIFVVLLVWIPSIMLTCFYYRSDFYQQRFR